MEERRLASREEALDEVLRQVRLIRLEEAGEERGADERREMPGAEDMREASEAGPTREKSSAENESKIEYENTAVLTMTEEEAIDAYRYLRERREDVYYIDRDSSLFQKGITVTTFYLAKGLEFDQVFVLGGEKESTLFQQFRYICATRALHELYVYDFGA